MDAELAAERALSRPILRNAERVRQLMEAGEHVVFLSDMYLPKDFIWELICRHVVPCEREQVLVSGEIGLSKHTGRLYRYLLGREGIEPGQLIHVGDNAHSDVRVARRLGIQAHHYQDIRPTRYERCFDIGESHTSCLPSLGGLASAAHDRPAPFEQRLGTHRLAAITGEKLGQAQTLLESRSVLGQYRSAHTLLA